MTDRSLAPTGKATVPTLPLPVPLSGTLGLFAAFFVAALAIRAVTFGNPLVQIDVQFYDLVGDRMLAGALPYVDIWDRKPIGLFLLFAGLRALGRALGESGPLPYQLAATACAAATALTIERIAREIASPRGASLAGLAYLPWLMVFNCATAQTPVFYNLAVAQAALLTLRTWQDGRDRLLGRGTAIMLLVGLALQLKYCVVFEGVGFGLALLWCAYRAGKPARALAGHGVTWVVAALAPTLLALAVYAAIGRGEAFVDANFLSIFRRHNDDASILTDLLTTIALLLPFAIVIVRGGGESRPGGALVGAWTAVAIAGYLVFGTYYDHYAAPLLVPLCALAAPALGRTDRAWPGVLLLGAGCAIGAAMTLDNLHNRGNRAQLEAMAAQIRPRLGQGCLYVYEGDPALYQATQSCLPGPYVFPAHIDSAVESRTLDQRAALVQVLARRPSVVVIADHPLDSQPSLDTRTMLRHALAHDYRRFGQANIGTRTYWLYARDR